MTIWKLTILFFRHRRRP